MCSLTTAEPPKRANEPGALRAAVHPAPLIASQRELVMTWRRSLTNPRFYAYLYSPMPSSATILRKPRPLNASGLVCLLIFSTSKGNKAISPMPTKLETRTEKVRTGRHSRLCCRLSANVLPASSCVHHGLAGLFTECRCEHWLVVVVQEIVDKRLTTKLVDTLSNLVPSSKSKTREEWSILLQGCRIDSILYNVYRQLMLGSSTNITLPRQGLM